MANWVARGVPAALCILAVAGCTPLPDEPQLCKRRNTTDAMAAPPGVARGEPYRWLARTWRSPLGMTIQTYGLAVDGVPVFDRHQVEVYDARGALVARAGTGDAVLAVLRSRDAHVRAAWRHPRAAPGDRRESQAPLRVEQRAVWHYADGDLVPAVATERLDLLGDTPVGEVALRDAATGAELARHSLIYELRDPAYLVYARDDGRPLNTPLGDAFPHPTGLPDGHVPAPVPQQPRRQSAVSVALASPWVSPSGSHSWGNNVVAFFNSLRDPSGKLVGLLGPDGKYTPEYGPEPDTGAGDFFAAATANAFTFRYDPTRTASEYFQDMTGTEMAPPDPDDVALNAKIVQAFYATNWMHDFFYGAGFDELAGNAQLSNLGRGGEECDPLLVHAGYFDTYTLVSKEGRSPVLDLGLNQTSASRRDSGMDFTVLGHEWGHSLIGRLVGAAPDVYPLQNMQGQALHEGIADFVGLLVNLNGLDAAGTYAIGAYTNLDYLEPRTALPDVEAHADAMYYGIRRYPYSLDMHKNPLTFQHIAVPPPRDMPYFNWKGRGPVLQESHTTGEVFCQALLQCFGGIVAAHPGASFEDMRARMAKYLVAALAMFSERPSLLEARNAVLTIVRMVDPEVDYRACRAGFAARGMGADALGPDPDFGAGQDQPPYDPAQVIESFLDEDPALR